MFCLATHEIQNSNSGKELRVGNKLAPANIRIHGAMYRKTFAITELTPVRYLLVDPRERAVAAGKAGLPKTILQSLERNIAPHNCHMQTLVRTFKSCRQACDVAIQLEWHEGLDEVAAVVDDAASGHRAPRAVLFRMRNGGQPQYLPPLSPLYEPLSYPLWFPRGGRGWSPGLCINGSTMVSQMWWYRQQICRFTHMHLCGRLLNEWLINMYCRMEDERLSLIRREQTQRTATRQNLCEVLAKHQRRGGPGRELFAIECARYMYAKSDRSTCSCSSLLPFFKLAVDKAFAQTT